MVGALRWLSLLLVFLVRMLLMAQAEQVQVMEQSSSTFCDTDAHRFHATLGSNSSSFFDDDNKSSSRPDHEDVDWETNNRLCWNHDYYYNDTNRPYFSTRRRSCCFTPSNYYFNYNFFWGRVCGPFSSGRRHKRSHQHQPTNFQQHPQQRHPL